MTAIGDGAIVRNGELIDPQPSPPSRRTLPVVYLIASHTNPGQVIRLVKTLKAGSPASYVVIHHDYSKSHLDPAAFADANNVVVLKNHTPCERGDFSLVTATLRAMDWILSNLTFDWLVFISGQDYPAQPLGQIDQFLETSAYDGFMSGDPLELWPDKRGLVGRYYYSYYRLPSLLRPLLSYVSAINSLQSLIRLNPGSTTTKSRIGFRARLTPFAPNFQCYKGSAWFSLSYHCVRAIDEYVRGHPAFVKHYRRTLCPDESFFLTILLNDPRFTIQKDDKRYIIFPAGHSHPNVLRITDLNRITSSGQHFARKFDINIDGEVLNMLDRVVLEENT